MLFYCLTKLGYGNILNSNLKSICLLKYYAVGTYSTADISLFIEKNKNENLLSFAWLD